MACLGTSFFLRDQNQQKRAFSFSFFFFATAPHLVSSATVLEQSTGTSRRLEDTGSFPMSTRSLILFAGGGGEGDVDMSWGASPPNQRWDGERTRKKKRGGARREFLGRGKHRF